MTMTLENPSTAGDWRHDVPPEFAALDFNAPATVGVVLYESQRIRNELRGEDRRMEHSLRADMASMEKSIRADMAKMERSLRADMASMERSLREEMAKNTRMLLTAMITLNGITLAAVGVMIRFL
ncbi:MAG: hypothetical protein ACO39D_09165 [Ilumatobacteraceae bacterium]